MERPAITGRFVIGVFLIITSLAIGKLVLVPIILFPTSNAWRASMIAIYIFSWIILIAGAYIAGKDSYAFVQYKYGEYSKNTINHVKRHSVNAAKTTAHVLRSPVKHTKQFVRYARGR